MDFNPECRSCPRLYHYRQRLARQYPNYHNRPVPASGDHRARLLIVGLAPGLHGANASGIPFTGDQSGTFLFTTLEKFGFAKNTRLVDCQITNAVKCVPPENRPTGREITLCNRYLKAELSGLVEPALLIALGGIAHNAVLKSFGLMQRDFKFSHLAEHHIQPTIKMIDSYHCSRYNVQTRRLTTAMFDAVFQRASTLLETTMIDKADY